MALILTYRFVELSRTFCVFMLRNVKDIIKRKLKHGERAARPPVIWGKEVWGKKFNLLATAHLMLEQSSDWELHGPNCQ